MIYNDGTCEENGEVWFVGNENNILYHININHEISPIAKIPTKSEDTFRLNPHCIKNGNTIICLPTKSRSIFVYDIELDEFKEYPIELDVKRYSIKYAWVEGDILWCICYRSGQLVKYNLISKKTDLFDVCEKSLECVCGEGVKIDNYIYILHKNKPMISRFDTLTEQICCYDLPCEERGFGTICYVDDRFYLTGYKKNIYIWNESNNTIETVQIDGMKFLIENEYESKITRFYQSKVVNEYLVLLPFNNNFFASDDVVVYNHISREIKVYTLSDDVRDRKCGEPLKYNYSINNKIFIQDYSAKEMWNIDMDKEEISKSELMKNRTGCEKFWEKYGFAEINTENDILDLNIFFNCI